MEIEFKFSDEEKLELLKIARNTLEAVVAGRKYSPDKPANLKLLRNAGAFVTLKKNGELRGCIGYVEPRFPVYATVSETAAKSAMCDPRFESVVVDELKDITVEISVLSPLERIKDVSEVMAGKHGVVIEKGFYKGLLLPQVATENNWDRDEFLSYTCLKAGLGKDCYKQQGVHIYIFTAEVFSEKDIGRLLEERVDEGT